VLRPRANKLVVVLVVRSVVGATFQLFGILLRQAVQVLSSGVRVVGCFQPLWLCVLGNTRSNYSSTFLQKACRNAAQLCVQADRRGSYSFQPSAAGRRRLNAALGGIGGSRQSDAVRSKRKVCRSLASCCCCRVQKQFQFCCELRLR
jgi:hypothetical protein